MSVVTLEVEERIKTGKNKVKEVRSDGYVPAVIYGMKKDPQNIKVQQKEFERILRSDTGSNTILELKFGKNNETVISHDISKDPITGSIKHIDFFRIDLNKPIHAEVDITFNGTPKGVKLGGVFLHHLTKLHIECKPTDIPVTVPVDISQIGLSEAIKVSDINLGETIKITSPTDLTIATVDAPRGLSTSETSDESDPSESSNSDSSSN